MRVPDSVIALRNRPRERCVARILQGRKEEEGITRQTILVKAEGRNGGTCGEEGGEEGGEERQRRI